jgi:hypothetical protein
VRRSALALLIVLGIAFPAASIAQSAPGDSAPRPPRRAPRRLPVTPELERSAFADPDARTLLARARAARVTQDSALRAYDAKSFQRVSLAVGVRRLGPERQLVRHEMAARVRWSRGTGLWVEPTGRRTGFSLGGATLDLTANTPIPYFPGRETLWLPFGALGEAARAEVNENDLIHPLAAGAEAYYRYATGDSVSIRLPDGRAVALRELRVTARRPDWRAFVGSFWFDAERGALVRAAYRPSAAVDIWQSIGESQRRELQEWEARARSDTGAAARQARTEAARVRREMGGIGAALGRAAISPLRAEVAAVTVEYGLHEGRFWLPRLHVAEGEAQGAFVRLPVKVEERFQYASVNVANAADSLSPVTTPAALGLAPDDTTWRGMGGVINLGPPGGAPRARPLPDHATWRAREDSLLRTFTLRVDSLRRAESAALARGDTAEARRQRGHAAWFESRARLITRRLAACSGAGADTATYLAGFHARADSGPRMAIRLPCNLARLDSSPDLPGSVYDENEQLFGGAERDALLATLGVGVQPGWGPQRPVVRAGLDLQRYNRVEGVSLAASATSVLGRGFTARALARFGLADRVPNGELSLARGDGRTETRLGVFHRLGVVNDDRGSPLSFGASLANLLYGRDEGFYYRAWGAELAGSRDAPGPLAGATALWRLFAERQRSAGVAPNTQASLGRLLGRARFGPNVDAAELTALGAGAELARSFGADPRGARVDLRLRGEGAFTSRADTVDATGYGRLVVDATIARPLGRLFAGALTAAGGTSAGDLPPQRAFHVGGLQTVRGQFARPAGAGRVGDAFWLGRAELGLNVPAARPSLFYDVGWAGAREALARPGRPLSGVGAGLSLLDGVLRLDVARGLWPERRWRVDLSVGARF